MRWVVQLCCRARKRRRLGGGSPSHLLDNNLRRQGRPPRFERGGAAQTLLLSGSLVLVLCLWLGFAERLAYGSRVSGVSLAIEIVAVVLLGGLGAQAGARWARDRSRLLEEAEQSRAQVQIGLSRLDDSTQLMRAVVETSPVATIAIDKARKVSFWSAGAEAMLGWTAEEVLGQPMPQEVQVGQPQINPDRLQATEAVVGTRAHWRTKGGDERIVEIYAAPLMKDGEIDGFAGQAVDITDREHARVQLERLRVAIDQTVDSVVIGDDAGVIVYANPAFEGRGGNIPTSSVGSRQDRIFAERFGPEVVASIGRAVAAGAPWFGEVDEPHDARPTSKLQLSLTPLRAAGGAVDGTVALLRDVTYMRSMEGDLALEAGVRGALGRAIYTVPPDADVHEASRTVCAGLTSIAGIDIASVAVFFEPSDAALMAISAPETLQLRRGDHLSSSFSRRLYEQALKGPWGEAWVSRPGDGAFGAALDDAGLKAFAFAPIVHGDHIDGGVGIGTADPTFAVTLAERFPLLVDFSSAPTALLAERLHAFRTAVGVRSEIEEMIEHRTFHPVFQPIIDLATKGVVGFEALTRFAGGKRPDLVFASARAIDLGIELEVATLKSALAASRGLPPATWLDVNVSPALLADTATLKELLSHADRAIVVEITEHEPIDDYVALREAVRALGPGVRLAVDDAGAGIANFGHILELQADLVKLDMSLVRGVDASPARQALVMGMKHFAGNLGCRLVAEGVETEAEELVLRAFGVEFGQGYRFGRPEAL